MPTLTITNVYLNALRDATHGASFPQITYIAVGDGVFTSPLATQLRLDHEILRKAASSYTNGSTGEILVSMYLSPSDIPGAAITEIGVFGGAATSALNTGTMIGRALYSHTKANNSPLSESITIVCDLTF